MNHFIIPFIYKIEKMNFIFIPFIKKEKKYKINHFVPHLYSENRQNEQIDQNEQNEQNEQSESFCPPLIFRKKTK